MLLQISSLCCSQSTGAYIVCERAPCHSSPGTEQLYLGSSLIVNDLTHQRCSCCNLPFVRMNCHTALCGNDVEGVHTVFRQTSSLKSSQSTIQDINRFWNLVWKSGSNTAELMGATFQNLGNSLTMARHRFLRETIVKSKSGTSLVPLIQPPPHSKTLFRPHQQLTKPYFAAGGKSDLICSSSSILD